MIKFILKLLEFLQNIILNKSDLNDKLKCLTCFAFIPAPQQGEPQKANF